LSPPSVSGAASPPEGWYPDPAGLPCERYWTGTAWSDHTRPQAPMNTSARPHGANDAQPRASSLPPGAKPPPGSFAGPRSAYASRPPQAASRSGNRTLLWLGVAALIVAGAVAVLFGPSYLLGLSATAPNNAASSSSNDAPSLSSLTLLQATNRIESGGLPCLGGSADDVGSYDLVLCNVTTSAAFQVTIVEGSLDGGCDDLLLWSEASDSGIDSEIAVGPNWFGEAVGWQGESTIRAKDIADALGGQVMRISDFKAAECKVQ